MTKAVNFTIQKPVYVFFLILVFLYYENTLFRVLCDLFLTPLATIIKKIMIWGGTTVVYHYGTNTIPLPNPGFYEK